MERHLIRNMLSKVSMVSLANSSFDFGLLGLVEQNDSSGRTETLQICFAISSAINFLYISVDG